MILYILAAACIAVSVPTAVLRHLKMEKSRMVAKLAASILFCLTAFLAAAQRTEAMNIQATLMLAGLVLGLMGDVVLGVDKFVPKDGRGYILIIGGVPFFFGHVAYIALLLSYGNFNLWLLLLLPILPLLFLFFNKLFPLGDMLAPMLLYALVLGGMMMLTLNLALQGGPLGRLMILPGILFAISDSCLFIGKYGIQKFPRLQPLLCYMVAIPYFSAQALFALTVSYL